MSQTQEVGTEKTWYPHIGNERAHRVIAERALGKPLPDGAEVHHVNGDPTDNRPENLVVCEDQAYHKLLHARQRALEECGHADWLKCEICHEYDDPENLWVHPERQRRAVHRECNARRIRERSDPVAGTAEGNRSPLAPADVRAIRSRLDQGETQKSIANDFGVDRSTISNIKNRKTWTHV